MRLFTLLAAVAAALPLPAAAVTLSILITGDRVEPDPADVPGGVRQVEARITATLTADPEPVSFFPEFLNFAEPAEIALTFFDANGVVLGQNRVQNAVFGVFDDVTDITPFVLDGITISGALDTPFEGQPEFFIGFDAADDFFEGPPDLITFVTRITAPDAAAALLPDISDAVQVFRAGSTSTPAGDPGPPPSEFAATSFSATVVPLPAPAFLLLAALGTLALVRKRA
ncbi:MAG: hypothetical protein AAF577_13980 [Pseudomonadota bacterium]